MQLPDKEGLVSGPEVVSRTAVIGNIAGSRGFSGFSIEQIATDVNRYALDHGKRPQLDAGWRLHAQAG